MNRLQIIFITMLLLASSVYAQQFEQTHEVLAEVSGLSREVNDSYVTLSYELPYTGMVILEIRDGNNRKIWQGQKVQPKGKNIWQLNRAAFKNEYYLLILRYKNSEQKMELAFPAVSHPISEIIYFDFRNIFGIFCIDPVAEIHNQS